MRVAWASSDRIAQDNRVFPLHAVITALDFSSGGPTGYSQLETYFERLLYELVCKTWHDRGVFCQRAVVMHIGGICCALVMSGWVSQTPLLCVSTGARLQGSNVQHVKPD
jgi:hypothetical protein